MILTDELIERIKTHIGKEDIQSLNDELGEVTLEVKALDWLKVAGILHDVPELAFHQYLIFAV
jgi:hypothetical protein